VTDVTLAVPGDHGICGGMMPLDCLAAPPKSLIRRGSRMKRFQAGYKLLIYKDNRVIRAERHFGTHQPARRSEIWYDFLWNWGNRLLRQKKLFDYQVYPVSMHINGLRPLQPGCFAYQWLTGSITV
jgi:hypothetical protein